jgi:hypothetical protein
MKIKGNKMFKKTLIAAALVAASSTAIAGTLTVTNTAYKVGSEYLGAYTGTALEGDLETAAIGIQYRAGIALGVNNTLKFVFAGGAISADTGLKLQDIDNTTPQADDAAVQTSIDTAAATVADSGDQAVDLAAMKVAVNAVIDAETSATNATAAKALINAVAVGANYAADLAAIQAVDPVVIGSVNGNIADLVDFEVDANGDYESVLFKLTGATTAAAVLVFNDTDDDTAANVTTTFTKATIGAGDLTVSLPEAKDDTGTNLTAPVASAKVLVTTADQFAVALTVAEDTIDVEQDRLFFSDGTGDALTSNFVFDVTVDATIDLGLDETTATFEAAVTGTTTGVDSIDYAETDLVGTNDTGAFDTDGLLAGVGISDATVSITVDGETNLATRTVKFAMDVTPAEADTETFTLVAASNAFIWDLNGSEITFPYAPIGFSNITTNFELANSGDQVGDVLITAFTRSGVAYSGTLVARAASESLTKISQDDVYEALGLTEGTSLSITFSTTAPDDDIKITGYSNLTSGGRMALLSDAYEGKINP